MNPLHYLVNKLKSLIAKGETTRTTEELAQVQITQRELREVPRFQSWGLATLPPKGGQALLLFQGGERGDGLCVAIEGVPQGLKEGELMLYTDKAQIHLKADGSVDINGGAWVMDSSGRLTIKGDVVIEGKVEVKQDIEVTGNIQGAKVSDSLGSLAGLRTAYNTHTHTGNAGTPTTPPTPTDTGGQ